MESSFEQLSAASAGGELDRFIEVDREFHAVHYKASGRESLWDRIIGLRYTAERYTRRGYQIPGITMKDTAASHEQLLAAVRDRDAERARDEITTDLENTFRKISADLRGGDGQPAQ
jgi:DNA-binding GntR family transcriptional regulator